MLVIISDLHLTDGTTGTTIGPPAFEDFHKRLEELAFDASQRSDERYEAVDTLDLVLLGDVFDVMRSTRWHKQDEGAGAVWPWDNWREDRFAAKIAQITDGILEFNHESLAVLRSFSQAQAMTVPAGPDLSFSTQRMPMRVRVHYVVGNHDWYYHLPGAAYDAIRQKIVDALGLCHGPEPFPHDPIESPLLMHAYRRHRLFARHGDIYDPFNYLKEEGRDAATLGDAIVVQLINRFPDEVRRRMDHLPPIFLDGLNELANVRPSLMVPVWIDGLLRGAQLDKEQTGRIKKIWDELADEFLETPFVRRQDKPLWPDIVDALQTTLHLSKRLPVDDIARLITLIARKGGTDGFSFAGKAVDEGAYQDGMADHIVYGHTHHYEVVPLDRRRDGERLVDRLCFNSGTWHAIHERTLQSRLAYQFASFHVMTYLAFFAEDERKGRAFETWSGTLGLR